MQNWWLDDPGARALVERRLGPDRDRYAKALESAGARVASELAPLSALADRHRPTLHRYDARGNRVDAIEYHPAYEGIRRLARELGIVASAYGPDPAPRVLTFALGYLFGQAEPGYFCPVCLTDGTAYLVDRHAPEDLRDRFLARLASPTVEDALEGAMFLTEKDGGSDVGSGTRTTAAKAADGSWRLSGEKWFCSNVDADLAFTLARPEGAPSGTRGLALFLLPRRLDGGAPNALRIERLKDKLGVTSMPTGELVLDGAFAWMVKPPGEGFRAMAEMLNLSRLYNAVASVAVARQAVRLAAEEGRRRIAFGRTLSEHPLYRRRVLDLAAEVELATGLVFEASALMDRAKHDPKSALALRALTPVVKAMTARLAVRAASEACEALGGNGYIEDFPTPRLLRDAQVLPIWEGTTNVLALDLLRAVDDGSFTALVEAFLASVPADAEGAAGALRALEDARSFGTSLAPADPGREARAFDLVERTYSACALAALVADAAWDRARGGERKTALLRRVVGRATDADPRAYATLVEGSA